MMEKLRRVSMVTRLIGVLILIGLLFIIGYQLYDFYEDKIGYRPETAIEDYFEALTSGDYARVYELTDKTHLTDIYGRPISRGEFYEQLDAIAGDRRIATLQVSAEKICEHQGNRYYKVTLQSALGGGAGKSRLIVEVTRSGKTWLIGYPFGIVLW